jgi:hypothetical protein
MGGSSALLGNARFLLIPHQQFAANFLLVGVKRTLFRSKPLQPHGICIPESLSTNCPPYPVEILEL